MLLVTAVINSGYDNRNITVEMTVAIDGNSSY